MYEIPSGIHPWTAIINNVPILHGLHKTTGYYLIISSKCKDAACMVTALRIVKFVLMGVKVCSCFLGYKWKVTCSDSRPTIIGKGYR